MATKASQATSTKAPELKPGAASTTVLVVDKHGKTLMPCSPGRARLMMKSKRADVFCANPFTIRILDREGGDLQEMELKIDPGSKVTGLTLMVLCAFRGWVCVGAWELSHRGQQIKDALFSRSSLRRGRRSRKTRYRQPRFLNRTRHKGWLPPSLQSRVDNVRAFARKFIRLTPVSGFVIEQVCFDLQLLENAEISGVQYQQGTLAGYEVREYLLLKWGHACSYCKAQGIPLQIEHIVPKSTGGSDRISNLCLACGPCNQRKSKLPVEVFLKSKPELLKTILRQAKAPLKDAAAVNSTRIAIVKSLESLGRPVITSTGGRTKFNRTQQDYVKSHWIDAACVGESGASVDLSGIQQVTLIQARGRGSRHMCKPDKFGFPRTGAKSVKRIHGFQTGDRVRLVQLAGKYQGVYEGVVSIRANGRFDIKAGSLKITAPQASFTRLSRFDGYTYTHQKSS